MSPAGKPTGAGTRLDPWDLATALKQPSPVQPGSLIWLLGGKYGNSNTYFFSQLSGTESNPIIVRQLRGERATIEGSLVIHGKYTWYWGFEVMSSNTDRTGDQYNPKAGTLDAVDVEGPYTKLIDLIVHDARNGLGIWTPAEGAEAYGCIVFNNGWQGPDRGHGHGIYTQNQNAQKHLGDNIIFNQFGLGIQAYGSSDAFVRNYLVDHNIVFNNGVLSRDGRTDNILFGIGGPLSGIKIQNNYTYHTPEANIGTSRIGWSFGGINQDAVVTDNYFIGGYMAFELWNWQTLTFRGNSLYSARSADVYLQLVPPQNTGTYDWDANKYYGLGQFYFLGQTQNFNGWKTATRKDAQATFAPGAPTGVWTFVSPNKYEAGRGHIAIYNWDKNESIAVDVTSVLTVGKTFEIRDAQNIFGPAVVSGTYAGGKVVIPMTGLSVMQPNGVVPNPPQHTAPQFGAFVIVQH